MIKVGSVSRLDWRGTPNYVARDFDRGRPGGLPGLEVAVADDKGPGETGRVRPGADSQVGSNDDDLGRRRSELDAALAARRPAATSESGKPATGGMAGFGQALKLSSEFIAGIVVGAGLGWLIDLAAGTSPWGLIIFLLLGFAAGVLNVLRSAGMVAEVGLDRKRGDRRDPDGN